MRLKKFVIDSNFILYVHRVTNSINLLSYECGLFLKMHLSTQSHFELSEFCIGELTGPEARRAYDGFVETFILLF